MNEQLKNELRAARFPYPFDVEPTTDQLIDAMTGPDDFFSLDHVLDGNINRRIWRACALHRTRKIQDAVRIFDKNKKVALARLFISINKY